MADGPKVWPRVVKAGPVEEDRAAGLPPDSQFHLNLLQDVPTSDVHEMRSALEEFSATVMARCRHAGT